MRLSSYGDAAGWDDTAPLALNKIAAFTGHAGAPRSGFLVTEAICQFAGQEQV